MTPLFTGRLERTGGHIIQRGDDFQYRLERQGRSLFAISSTGNSTYQGTLTHDAGTNTIRAHLLDAAGFGLLLDGAHRDGGYDLCITVTIPEAFKVPFIDG